MINCCDCECWDPMTEGSDVGLCRLRPPQLITETQMQADPIDGHEYPTLLTRSAWCATFNEDSCYEGKPRKAQKVH